MPAPDRADLQEEPQFALQLAKEEIESRIKETASIHATLLGEHYPFEIAPRPGIILERKEHATEDLEGLCYLCMQLHLGYIREAVEFGTSPAGRQNNPQLDFTQPFERLFEFIAGVAVSNHIGGLSVLLSESRSFDKLYRQLKEVCRIGAAATVPKSKNQVNSIQRRSNDGGIDAVVMQKYDGRLHETTLVGATIQATNLRPKMVGPTPISRFRGFFVDGDAMAPYRGCLVHPFPYQLGRHETCNEANCSYFFKDLILQNLRPMPMNTNEEMRCSAAARRVALNQLQKLSKLSVRIEYDEYPLSI